MEGWTHRPCPHGKSTTAARVDATSQLLEIEIVGMEDVSEPAASGQKKRKHHTAFVAEPAASGQKKRKQLLKQFVAEAAASGQNKRKHDTAFVAEAAASGQNTTRSLTRARTIDIDEAEPMIAACRMKALDASHFLDSTLLQTLIAGHSANFKTLLGPGCVHLGREHVHASSVGELTWGSLCSGSEGAHFVMDALNEHFGTLDGVSASLNALHLRQVFACEIVPQKRRWIDALVNSQRRALDLPLMCIFCDIRDMGETTAHCCVHNRLCIVPDCDILVASTSCKDLSKLSSNKFGKEKPVLSRNESPGGSADSFRGLLTYMDSHSIEMLVYENSDSLDDSRDAASDQKSLPDAASGQKSNVDIFTAEITSRNMEGQSFVLNSCFFGVPANRRRFWAVFLKSGGSRLFDFRRRPLTDVFRTLRLLVQVCQRLPPSADRLLLKDSDPAVCSELARRTSVEREAQPFTWIKEHQKILDLLLVPMDAPPPCDATSQSPWFKTLSRKQQSTLIIHQATMLCSKMAASGQQCKKTVGGLINPTQEQRNAWKQLKAPPMSILDRLRKGVGGAHASVAAASGQTADASDLKFMIDLMPSPTRVSASTEDIRNVDVMLAPCILPSQLLWIHSRDDNSQQRLLLGQEAMLFQGWPIGRIDCVESTSVTNTFLHDLAGNATSPPVLLAVVLAMFYSVSWKSQDALFEPAMPEAASDADVDEALALWNQCKREATHVLDSMGL